MTLSVEQILNDPATSFWLKDALEKSLIRDPVDAMNDAEILFSILHERLNTMMAGN